MTAEIKINEDGTLTYKGKVYKVVEELVQTSPETKESFFAGIVKDLERKEARAKYPDSIFWLSKAGKFMFEHDQKNGGFWCSYDNVWSYFETKFGMNYIEIQAFIKDGVEEHFKCGPVTPCFYGWLADWLVEEHFKCGPVTPQYLLDSVWKKVEEHFKCGPVTPSLRWGLIPLLVEERFKCGPVTPNHKW